MASDGLLVTTSDRFNAQAEALAASEKTLLDSMTKDGNASNPATLAKYQAIISEMNIVHTARSSIVKVLKDTSSGIISNFR